MAWVKDMLPKMTLVLGARQSWTICALTSTSLGWCPLFHEWSFGIWACAFFPPNNQPPFPNAWFLEWFCEILDLFSFHCEWHNRFLTLLLVKQNKYTPFMAHQFGDHAIICIVLGKVCSSFQLNQNSVLVPTTFWAMLPFAFQNALDTQWCFWCLFCSHHPCE